MRNLLTLFALFACAALASANGPAQSFRSFPSRAPAYDLGCAPAAVVRAPVYVQRAPVVYQQAAPVYSAPVLAAPVCAPVLAAPAYDLGCVQAAPVYSAPVFAAPVYQRSFAVQAYASPQLALYGQPAFLGGNLLAVTRRRGLFERLGDRQGERRDQKALRQAPGASVVIRR